MMKESVHLKGLNGLRAIAAFGVVIAHTTAPDFNLNSILPIGLAHYSVTIFFTLSGFLITYLLFLEKEQKEISVKKFYIRRILRIWPLYFAYLLVACIISYIQTPEELPGSLPYYLFFAANVPAILLSTLPYLGHYWSLGVEEQFYLFWPWIIKRSGNVLKGVFLFTAIFLVIKLIVRLFFFDESNTIILRSFFITRFECMSIGGIGALLCLQKNKLFFKLTANNLTEIICWLCIGVIAANRFFVSPFVNHDIVAVITVCIIVNLSFNKKAIINLENRFFDFLGKISYGIYIIHPLVVIFFSRWINQFNLLAGWKYIILYSGVLLLTVILAWLSYEFFEKRFLRLKDRFSVVKTVA